MEIVPVPTNGGERLITGNQEDVDLIVGFERDGTTHLLLIEAKAETSWGNKQMHSKDRRLRQLFGDDGRKHPSVQPHFALTSPRRPQGLASEEWAEWMTREGQPIWFELQVPRGLRKATRCDRQGKSTAEGDYFRVAQR